MLRRVAVDDGIDRGLDRPRNPPGSPRSRNATAAERLPPALSPATATRRGDAPNRAGVGECPPRDRLAVVETGGERMLGREAILDGHDGGAGAVRELARDVVHQPDAADAEPASVEVHDETGRRCVVLVDANPHAGHDVVGDLRDVARWARPAARRRTRASERLSGEARTARRSSGSPRTTRRPTDRARLRRHPRVAGSCDATPVDPDYLARDVTGLLGDEERTRGGDVFGTSGPAHRRARGDVLRVEAEQAQSAAALNIGVSIEPGGMVFTVMPVGPKSCASALVMPIIPAFDDT